MAAVCIIEAILLELDARGEGRPGGNKKNRDDVANLFSMAAEGISTATNYEHCAST